MAMVEPPDLDSPYHHVVLRGFLIASEHDQHCKPIHLLASLSELDGPIGAALNPSNGGVLLPRPPDAPKATGGGASYLSMQTMQAASQFALSRNETVSAAHLLVAIIDQGEGDAMSLLDRAGIEPGQVRQTALAQLGAPTDLPAVEIPRLVAAGYLDRPILSEADLDSRAWQVLTWRQAHLPLDILRNPSDWKCLRRLECESARRMYRRLHLHEDQELSLLDHHLQRVQQIAHDARPDLVPPVPPPRRLDRAPVAIQLNQGGPRRPRHRQLAFLSFTIGWGTWFGNRWSGIKRRRDWIQTQLFAFRTRTAYRDAPKPTITGAN